MLGVGQVFYKLFVENINANTAAQGCRLDILYAHTLPECGLCVMVIWKNDQCTEKAKRVGLFERKE